VLSSSPVQARSSSSLASSAAAAPHASSASASSPHCSTHVSIKTRSRLSRLTTLDDTIEMLNDHIMDALAFLRDSFRLA
jgi:hypothetical protein